MWSSRRGPQCVPEEPSHDNSIINNGDKFQDVQGCSDESDAFSFLEGVWSTEEEGSSNEENNSDPDNELTVEKLCELLEAVSGVVVQVCIYLYVCMYNLFQKEDLGEFPSRKAASCVTRHLCKCPLAEEGRLLLREKVARAIRCWPFRNSYPIGATQDTTAISLWLLEGAPDKTTPVCVNAIFRLLSRWSSDNKRLLF